MPGWMKTLGYDHFYDFPPWVFQITTSVDRDGDIWLLDTMDGTVTKYIITGAVYPEPVGRYQQNDPRMWRQVYCDEDTLTLKKWLDGVLEKYKTLQWFGIPRAQHPGVFGPREYDDEESESYKQVEVSRNSPTTLCINLTDSFNLGTEENLCTAWMARSLQR